MVENRPCKNKGEQRFNYFCNSHGPTQSNKKRRRYSNADRIIFTSKQRKQILETYGSTCYLCKKEIYKGSYWHIDHIHPWSKGGSNNIANLRPTHPKCNEIKSAKIINNRDLWLKAFGTSNAEGYVKALHYLWLTKAYMTCQRAWVWCNALTAYLLQWQWMRTRYDHLKRLRMCSDRSISRCTGCGMWLHATHRDCPTCLLWASRKV